MEQHIDINAIRNLLPHRYPFLLVDRVVAYEKGKSLTALKNITVNEPQFQGHFPVAPIFPGVLIIEALAQACGLLAFVTAGRPLGDGNVFYLVGVDGVRFKRPVVPGDQLFLHVELRRSSRGVWKFATRAEVDGTLVAGADLMCAERGAA